MAKLMLIGKVAEVELIGPQEPNDSRAHDELWTAACTRHRPRGLTDVSMLSCSWAETYDTLSDAAEYAEDHADRGRA